MLKCIPKRAEPSAPSDWLSKQPWALLMFYMRSTNFCPQGGATWSWREYKLNHSFVLHSKALLNQPINATSPLNPWAAITHSHIHDHVDSAPPPYTETVSVNRCSLMSDFLVRQRLFYVVEDCWTYITILTQNKMSI